MTGTRADLARRWLTRSLSDAMGSVPKVALYGGSAMISGDPEGEENPGGIQPFGDGGMIAFEAIGALPEDELERWRRRFDLGRQHARATGEPDPQAVSAGQAYHRTLENDRLNGAVSLLIRVGLMRLDSVAPRVDNAQSPEPIGDTHDLGAPRAVMPVPLVRHDGVCLTCIELYELGLVIHWHALHAGNVDLYQPPPPALVIADDVGTDYGEVSSGGGSWSPDQDEFAVLGSSEVATAPLPDARALTISSGSGEWLIPLADA